MLNHAWRRGPWAGWWLYAGVLGLMVLVGGCSRSNAKKEDAPKKKYEVADDTPADLQDSLPAASSPSAANAAPARTADSVAGGGAPAPADSMPQPPSVARGELDAKSIPQGTPAELMDHLRRLTEELMAIQMQMEQGGAAPASLQPTLESMLETSDKILASDVDDAMRKRAIDAKAGALVALSQLAPDRPWADKFREFATSLAADKDPTIALNGRAILLNDLVNEIAQGRSQDIEGMMTQLKALLADEHRDISVLNVAQRACVMLGTTGRETEGRTTFELVANAFKDHPDAQLAAEADNMFEQLAMVDLQIGEKLKDVVLKREGAVAAFTDALTQVFQRPRPGLIVLRKATESWLPALEQSGNFELAGKLCEMLAAAYQNHTNPEVRKLVQQRTDMTRRRLGLLGQPLSVEGKLLDGSPLDYTPYQGKAVLVVFWASFSPVSRPALLAIKPLYEKYHAQGLEVIGVCLDEELTAANRLINELQLPWTTITNSKWAQQLGIEMIPYLLLADQQGKVVDLYMATSDLDAKLAGLLGVAPPATTQPPVNELREPAATAK